MQDSTLRRLIECLKEEGYADHKIVEILIRITSPKADKDKS